MTLHNAFGEHGVCAICRKRPVERWCDYIIVYENSVTFVRDYKRFIEINRSCQHETCDLPMCAECATNVSRERDFCPHHLSLYRKVQLSDEYQRRRQGQEKAKIAKEDKPHA